MTSVEKHLDIASVPVLCEAHVTVNLEKESLAFIKLLVDVSSIEGILCFGVFNYSHENFWSFGQVDYTVNCFFGFIKMFHVPLLMHVDLIINNESQSFRVCCFVNNIIDSVSELCISVRSNANKDRPVIWERKWNIVFHYYLIEENSDCKVIVAKSRANLMLHMLTLENNRSPELWHNIGIRGTITVEQTKRAIFLWILFL